MLTFIFLFFLAVVGIATYFISLKAKRKPNGMEGRVPPRVTNSAKVGRATGSGDD